MSNRILNYPPIANDFAILLLRLIIGGMFVHYGYTKISMYNEILPNFQSLIGLGGKTEFILVIFAEFFCGFLVVIGLGTRLAVIPIFIVMVVAYFIAHGKDPFTVKQLAFIYMLLCLPLFLFGGGRFSLDALIFRRKKVAV